MSKYFFLISIALLCADATHAQEKSINPEITSSNKQLTKTFEWAIEKARSYVQTGKQGPINISEAKNSADRDVKTTYIPSYWAGYPLRSAFYSRDFCHQISGAHLLGLQDENYQMLTAFAKSADSNKKGYPLWAINFDGSAYILDYKDDNDFVREVPAVFELVEKGYELYLWTGDRRYIFDETLWNYYSQAVTTFVNDHDGQIKNGVAEGTGKGIFQGVATYNEQHDHPLIEAGDGIASQYKAFLAYAKMAEIRGDKKLAAQYFLKAADLKSYFNKDWGIKNTETYNRGYTLPMSPVDGWGKENSWFMPMKGITEASSARNLKYLDFIEEQLNSKDGVPGNIEAISYIPELFFKYQQNERAWKWMQYIISNIDQEHEASALTGKNGNYPEVSYVFISNVIEGLLGVVPNAERNEVATLSHLTPEVQSLSVKNIRIGSSVLEVEHQLNRSSRIHYQEGNGSLKWKAAFPGNLTHLYVNGKKQVCSKGNDSGKPYSYVIVNLSPKQQVTVTKGVH